MRIKATWQSAVLALAAFMVAGPASAGPIYTGSNGTLSASVEFDIVGTDLIVTLTNTSTADVLAPGDVLTAVFFNLDGDPALSRDSAVLNASTVFYDSDGQPAGGVVGGEWAYLNGLTQYGANAGISSSGFGLFGPSNVFPGANLAGPVEPDGVQYGLLSAGDDINTGNGGITGSDGLIRNSVTFTLDSLPAGFTSADIGTVTFQYGTALTETHIIGECTENCPPLLQTPEPGSLALIAVGALALAATRRKLKR
jgi:hypothetical protein